MIKLSISNFEGLHFNIFTTTSFPDTVILFLYDVIHFYFEVLEQTGKSCRELMNDVRE